MQNEISRRFAERVENENLIKKANIIRYDKTSTSSSMSEVYYDKLQNGKIRTEGIPLRRSYIDSEGKIKYAEFQVFDSPILILMEKSVSEDVNEDGHVNEHEHGY